MQVVVPSTVNKQKQLVFDSEHRPAVPTQASPPGGQTPDGQSSGHVNTSSPMSQVPFPHVPTGGQSVGHWMLSSPGSHTPLPHTGFGQSCGQLIMFSPTSGSQTPFPQTPGHGPQSSGQLLQSSPSSQMPLPHVGGQGPQS
jgi:hypothetical protein